MRDIIRLMNENAVHCKTEDEAVALLNELKEHNIVWAEDGSPLDFTCYDYNKSETCYHLDGGLWTSSLEDYVANGHRIVEFDGL